MRSTGKLQYRNHGIFERAKRLATMQYRHHWCRQQRSHPESNKYEYFFFACRLGRFDEAWYDFCVSMINERNRFSRFRIQLALIRYLDCESEKNTHTSDCHVGCLFTYFIERVDECFFVCHRLTMVFDTYWLLDDRLRFTRQSNIIIIIYFFRTWARAIPPMEHREGRKKVI